MGVKILNLQLNGLYVVMVFFYAAVYGKKEPILEVVSIYNDEFTTPVSREPYFIKVYRCVDGHSRSKGGGLECYGGDVAVPEYNEEIEIFVPDLNNRTKFYKYVVYNHTSCKCGNPEKERKLYKKAMQEVNETVFQKGYGHNPVNLRNKCGFCDKPQPRYRRHTDFKMLFPQSKYYLKYQCLPGCLNDSAVVNLKVKLAGGFFGARKFINDTGCAAYAPSDESRSYGGGAMTKRQQSIGAPQENMEKNKSSNDNEPSDMFIISLGSARLFLAALVLSFVLLIILILDLGLCRKKKGLFYALCSCAGDNNAKGFSHNYFKRRINEITV